jgi:transposase
MRTWRLTAAQRRTLERELARARDADLFRRILALLEVDAGCPLGEVAQRLRVDRRSVQRWIARYRSHPNIETLRHQPGQGRPRRWDPALEARLELALSQRPTDLGYVGTGWTVPLLQQWLASDRPGPPLSVATLRRRLRERDYVWKRFRYVLSPDPQREKKTPDPSPDPGLGPAHGALGPGRNRLAAAAAPAGGLGAPGPTGAGPHQRSKRPAHRVRQPESADGPRPLLGESGISAPRTFRLFLN